MKTAYPENYTQQLQRLLALVAESHNYYMEAAEKVKSGEFKELFKQFELEREAIKDELKTKIQLYGAEPTENEFGFVEKLQHTWLALKAMAGGSGDQEVLESCRNMDQSVLDGYDEVLQGTVLENKEMKYFLVAQRFTINESFMELDRRYFDLFSSDNSL